MTIRPALLRTGLGVLRALWPVARWGDRILVTRHADVLDVLRREAEFSVVGIYAERMRTTTGAFFLGMDEGPRYHAEADVLRGVLRYPEDLDRVRALTRSFAKDIVDEARRRGGTLDAVDALTREVPIRLVDDVFGVPAPDGPTMRRWMRDIFGHLFFYPADQEPQRGAARQAASELVPYLLRTIEERRVEGYDGPSILDRLLRLQAQDPDGIDDDFIQRNLAGLIVGAVDTTSKAAVHALAALLDRPPALEGARRAARGDDRAALLAYVFEALRFEPFNPLMQRSVARRTVVGRRGASVGPGSTVWVSPLSAMFDPRAFEEPGAFRTDRPIAGYLHFGYGLHRCYGALINRITLPEILRPLLADDDLRARRRDIAWDSTGTFPDRWPVAVGTT